MEEGTRGGTTTPIPIPTGERVLAGLRTYFAGSPDSSCVVVVACDSSGYEDPNIRSFANKIAERGGYYVVVPDFCRGDPFVPGGDRLFPDWLQDHHPMDDALEDAKLVCRVLDYFHCGIGGIGIGWGGRPPPKLVVELALPQPPPLNFYPINFAVLLDPFSIALDDFRGCAPVPVLVCGAKVNRDHAYHPKSSQLFEDISNALATESEVVRFVKLVQDAEYEWSLGNNAVEEQVVECNRKVLMHIFDWISRHINVSLPRKED